MHVTRRSAAQSALRSVRGLLGRRSWSVGKICVGAQWARGVFGGEGVDGGG